MMIMSDGSHSSTLRLDTYPAIETLERQYAAPVGQRIALLVHVNGHTCSYASASANANSNNGDGTLLSRPSLSPTASTSSFAAPEDNSNDHSVYTKTNNSDKPTETSAAAASDPFSFLSQDNHPGGPPTTAEHTTASSSHSGNRGGLRGFISKVAQSTTKVAQSTTQRLERGMTQLAIKANAERANKAPDKLLVALVDVSTHNSAPFLVGLTESRDVPSADNQWLVQARNQQGLRFAIPLYVPGAAPPTAQLQCHVYWKPGTAPLWQSSKPVLVGTTPVWTAQQLRQAAAAAAVKTSIQTKPTQWTLTLQSSVVVDGKLTCTVLPDPKFPVLCGPGWSLADPVFGRPSSTGPVSYPVHVFDYPLDQSYALPLTLPTTTAGNTTLLDATATENPPPPPPPPATSTLLLTERTTESAVVLPLATAWWSSLVAPAVKVSYAHATGVAAQVAYQRHDSATATSAVTAKAAVVETHVTMHQLTLSSTTAPGASTASNASKRISVHCQRPDSIFEVEWGEGTVVAVDAQTTPAGAALPPPATVLAYPKPVSLTHVLPALQQAPAPPHGYRLGTLRFQIQGDGGSNAMPIWWEAFVDLDGVLAQNQSGTVLRLPVVLADQPAVVVGHLHVTVRLTPPTGAVGFPTPSVSPAEGLVALVGLATQEPNIQPALDALTLAAQNTKDEQVARRIGQLATMGYFFTKDYMEYHMQQVRSVDSNEMDEKAKAYEAALQASAAPSTAESQRPPPHQDRSPRAFRPSSSRSEVVLSGIPFNCHTATLQLSLITEQEKRDVAYFYNVTCGAPADHARDFGNIFRKYVDLPRLGLVSPVGPVTGGLRRLEAKRLEIIKVVEDLQTMMIMQVANYFVTERSKRKVVNHVPTRDVELQNLRWKLFEAVQTLHHTTWTCAVRRASVFSQALGLAVTCFLASLSDAAKVHSTWPDLWAKHGFLVCFEGLLSAAGKELGMIEDASVGIDMLKNVQIILVPDDGASPTSAQKRFPVPHSPYLKWVQIKTANQTSDGATEYMVYLGMSLSYYDQRVPANFKNGTQIRLYPLLFEVGVDIRQWGAHAASNASKNYRRGDSGEELGGNKEAVSASSAHQGLLDDEDDDVGITDDDVLVQLNFEAFQKLNVYAHRISPSNPPSAANKVHPLLETLHQHILNSSGKINHDILDEAATLSQQLGGGAAVFCKSGKDRTAMHVTYKQSQFANRYKRHWSPDATPEVILEASLEDAATIRTHGTRLPICEKNVGQAKFAFNSLQVKFMPEKLKPTMNTLAGFLKGGKVFSGGGIES